MRIAILHDHPCWAQAQYSDGLKKYAPSCYDVERHLLHDFKYSGEDIVYVINLASCRYYGSAKVVTCMASHAWMHNSYDPGDWRTRGVSVRRNSRVAQRHIRRANVVICRNRKLEKWAQERHKNARYIPVGVDTEIFRPESRVFIEKKLRVGWCGQINPGIEGHFKGYYEIWEPLKAELGDRYEFVENTRIADDALNWHELADWYRSLDVYVTTASAEGTPNGPFQAAACGVPVISTDVGQVADWSMIRNLDMLVPSFGNEDQAATVRKEIAVRLRDMEDPGTRWSVSQALLESIQKEYCYSVIAPLTLDFIAQN